MHGEGREDHADEAAAYTDQDAFEQKLRHNATGLRAEGVAERKLTHAVGRAHKQQAGDVDDGDQQNECSHRHDHHERLGERCAIEGEAFGAGQKEHAAVGNKLIRKTL